MKSEGGEPGERKSGEARRRRNGGAVEDILLQLHQPPMLRETP